MTTRCLHKAPARRRPIEFAFVPPGRRAALATGVALVLCLGATPLSAATCRTTNFDVSAKSADTAGAIARHAEELRSGLSREWLGTELPAWSQRCRVRVDAENDRLTGDTTYTLASGRVTRWQMVLRGPLERIMETLLPHEILHTILASHFQGAVPRWADEGAALSVEAEADQRRLWALAGRQLAHGSRQPLNVLFAVEQYPTDRDALRAFYVQGAAVTEFLLMAGKPRFLDFVRTGVRHGWDRSAADHYGFANVAGLEAGWVEWLQRDRPVVLVEDRQTLADAAARPDVGPTLAATSTERNSDGESPIGSGSAAVRFGSP